LLQFPLSIIHSSLKNENIICKIFQNILTHRTNLAYTIIILF
jgi:hypothetical protein